MEDGEKKVSVSALKAIKDRRSIRKFKSEPISEMDLHTILEAGIAAPSSKNRQPWHFTVVRGEAKEELTCVMERGLNLEVKAHEPFLPDSMKYINGAFTSVNVMREAPVVVLVSNERGKGIDFTDNLSVHCRCDRKYAAGCTGVGNRQPVDLRCLLCVSGNFRMVGKEKSGTRHDGGSSCFRLRRGSPQGPGAENAARRGNVY